MKFPKALSDANDRIGDVLNHTLYYRGGWLDIRVLDAINAVGLIVFTAYAWLTHGWLAAAQTALMYVFVIMCIVWFFPSSKVMK